MVKGCIGMWPIIGSLVGLAIALLVAACGGGSGGPSLGPGPSGLKDGLPEFDITATTWNGYWYSRYNLGNLAMMSGLGVPFMPDMKDVQAMVMAVDQGPAEGEHVAMPKNAALLKAVYAGGSPALVNGFDGDPMNLANWRWDTNRMDTTITTSAQAQTIIKEVEWAKLFNNASWAGKVTDNFGAMDRFKGVALFAEAKMQVQFALSEMLNSEGLFVAGIRHLDGKTTVVDGTAKPADQFQMLQALADLHHVLHNPEAYNGVYADEAFHQVVTQAADDLFRRLSPQRPEGLRELSLGAQALVWYAAITHDAGLQQRALDQLRAYGELLVKAPRKDAIDRAVAVRGLVEAGRVLGDDKYLKAAAKDFQEMASDYHAALGYFRSKSKLTIWEVGDVIGALNALSRHGRPEVDTAKVTPILVGFFEAAVNRSGLMQAAPPKEMEASPFELKRVSNPMWFAYPTIPTPDKAGLAPVDASEIAMDEQAGRWVVTNGYYDTAGSMHASNEQNWLFGVVNGFPEVRPVVAKAP
jgi:hypothetical protein